MTNPIYTVPEARNVAWHDRVNAETAPCTTEQLSAALQSLDALCVRMKNLAEDLRTSVAEDFSKPQRAALALAAELIERELKR
jgi:hypothetical protein